MQQQPVQRGFDMNRRLSRIISEFKNKDAMLSLASLANLFGVSEKTIRNDIAQINESAPAEELKPLKIRTNGMIDLENKALFEQDKLYNLYDYKLSRNERRDTLMVLLAQRFEKNTIQSLQEELFVSRNTIISDMEEARGAYAHYGIEIKAVSKKGFILTGEEKDIRRALLDIFLLHTGKGGQCDHFGEYLYGAFLKTQSRSKIRSEMIKSKKYIQKWEIKSGIMLSDESFYQVCAYLIIVLNRVMRGNVVHSEQAYNPIFLTLAKEIMQYVFQEEVFESEIALFANFLEMQSYMQPPLASQNEVVRAQVLAARFLEKLSKDLHSNLAADNVLLGQLAGLISSLVGSGQKEIDKKEALQEEHSNIKAAVIKNLDVLCMNELQKKSVLSQIVMYVKQAVEKSQYKPIRIIFICHEGLAITNYLMEQIKIEFNVEFVAVLPSHNAKQANRIDADLIVSTLAQTGLQKECIVITTRFSGNDYQAIKEKIGRIHIKCAPEVLRNANQSNILVELIPVIHRYVKDEKKVLSILSDMGEVLHHRSGGKSIKDTMLHEMLPHNHIRIEQSVKNSEEAIWLAAKELLTLQYIEQCYVEATIKNLKENGPYFVLSNFLAIAHADCENGVHRTGMSLLKLRKPVCFGEGAHQIQFILMLGAVDTKIQKRALPNLFQLIKIEEFRKALLGAKTAKEIAELIRNYELLIDGF